MNAYAHFARFYDIENANLTEDIAFWIELAREFGGPILELGCGTGRITLQLAREGFAVVGVDSSPEMLNLARKKLAQNPRFAERIEWIEADFTKLSLKRTFPLLIAPFNTLSHLLNPEDMRGFLDTACEHLSDGGVLVFDLPNPAHVYGDFPEGVVLERTFPDDEKGTTIQQFSSFRLDRTSQLGYITWIYDETSADGILRRTTIPLTMRYFFPAELRLWLESCGFHLLQVWGDFEKSPLDDASPKMILLAQKS